MDVLTLELHCHSAASYDGRDSVEAMLERAAAVGLDAIAITDHDGIDASLRAVDLAGEYDMIGIPGVEISSAAGHVLGVGIEEIVPPALPFAETVERIRAAGGLAIVPHPFQEMRQGVMANITREELATADAIEVYNSRLFTGRSNRQARKDARSRDLPMAAGSDAHIAEMVGQAVTMVDPPEPTGEAILAEIREGRTEIAGRRTPWLLSARQFTGGLGRRAAHWIQARGN
jgi:predicted metal-dependent phosphoesterase TrpH